MSQDPSNEAPKKRRTVAISGAGGLVGSALKRSLLADGHRVVRLVRRPAQPLSDESGVVECQWSTTDGIVDKRAVEGIDAFVHLAGENLAAGRWTEARRRRIRDSRILGTRNVVASLAALERPPQAFVCASAIGYYGDRGAEELVESSAPGEGFLAEICVDWEAEARRADDFARSVQTRFGVILSPDGGALDKMLTPFRLGMGGRLGDGQQYMSWVTLPDVIAALRHVIEGEHRGPVNVTAPHPVTNRTFTDTLASALSRPAILPVPATALRLALGDMADEALLASVRALPEALQRSGFAFAHPQLDAGLAALL